MQPKGDFQFWFFFDIINNSYSLNQLEKVLSPNRFGGKFLQPTTW